MENGDTVIAQYRGSAYIGKLSKVDKPAGIGTISMAPGVDMILPLNDMTKVEEGTDNGTYSI